jgi:hypothetical protein
VKCQCPKCFAESDDIEICSSCGVIFSKYDVNQSFKTEQQKLEYISSLKPVKLPVWLDVVLPLVIVFFSYVLVWSNPLICWYLASNIHEFGHASAAWFGGAFAIPIPLGQLSFTLTKPSWWFTLFFSTILFALTYHCIKRKLYFLASTFLLTFIVQIYFRIFFSNEKLKWVISWMGMGGELWIAAWMMIAYYYKFPKKMYWMYFRHIIFLIGSIVFFYNLNRWLNIRAGIGSIPFGSDMGGRSDAGGDMNKLSSIGWSDVEIISSYLKFAYICLSLIIFNYLVHSIKLLTKKEFRGYTT